MRDHKLIVILIIITIFLSFVKLGNMALTDPDETFYAESAKEMLDSGQWSTPLIFGEPQFEKPPLYYWLIMASYKMFGVNEFAARFPSAVLAIFGVLGIFFLGRILFSSFCGFISGIVFATCVEGLVLSRGCVTDMTLTVFILLCFTFFLIGQARQKTIFYLMAAAMAALAVLTKGPIGLFITGAVILLYLIFSRQLGELKKIPIGQCLAIFLVVALPWYIVVTRIHGARFISEFFGFQNVTRFLHPEHTSGISPFFYIPVVIGGLFPWSLFLPSGAWLMYKNRKFSSKIKASNLFLLVWFLLVFVFFSTSKTKLVTYIFPLFPVLAVVVGRFFERLIFEKDNKTLYRYFKWSYYPTIVISFIALIGICIFIKMRYPLAFQEVIVTEIFFAIGLVISLFYFIKGKNKEAIYGIVLAVLLMAYPLTTYILPIVGEYESSKVLCNTIKESYEEGDLIGGECDNRRGIAFYSDKPEIVNIHTYPEMVSFISQPKRAWGIIKNKHYVPLKEKNPDKVSEPIKKSGKRVLFTNKPQV